MRILFDTNILLSLQIIDPLEIEPGTEPASRLLGHLRRHRVEVLTHPAARRDLDRDSNSARRKARSLLLESLRVLEAPPPIPEGWLALWPNVVPGGNDWVDLLHLSALRNQAVDLLVTEDLGLQRKAARIGLSERTLPVSDALTLVRDLFPEAPTPPPATEFCRAYSLDPEDPIFDSFRIDYPGFDTWFDRCRREHRPAWVVRGENGELAAFAILKENESEFPAPLSGKVQKLCSFKVNERYTGARLGELLLKAVFDQAALARVDWLFVSIFEHHERLVVLFEDFGFRRHELRTSLGELVLSKPLREEHELNQPDSALERHIRYGPPAIPSAVPWYVVPIEPRFAQVLFPDCQPQLKLLPGKHAFGNALRKAYLCHASIRSLPPGSVVAFYASRTQRALFALGVVEDTFRSSDPEEVARRVARRTVYSFGEIEGLCSRRTVLGILFRYAGALRKPIAYSELLAAGVLQGPPQSLQSIPELGVEWILRCRA